MQFYVCESPTAEGINNTLQTAFSTLPVFDLDFSRSATEDTTSLLRDMQAQVVIIYFLFLFTVLCIPFYFN